MEEYLKIPKERIAVLIGREGETKRKIEKITSTKIEVDSENGEIDVNGKEGDALNFYIALNIIKAIGRGFSPEHAFLLKEEGNILEIIELNEFLGKSEKLQHSKKGRIIGRKGRIKREIEEKTNVLISVYGKTVSVIGKPEEVEKASNAIKMLLRGSTHNSAEEFLSKKSREKFEL